MCVYQANIKDDVEEGGAQLGLGVWVPPSFPTYLHRDFAVCDLLEYLILLLGLLLRLLRLGHILAGVKTEHHDYLENSSHKRRDVSRVDRSAKNNQRDKMWTKYFALGVSGWLGCDLTNTGCAWVHC